MSMFTTIITKKQIGHKLKSRGQHGKGLRERMKREKEGKRKVVLVQFKVYF